MITRILITLLFISFHFVWPPKKMAYICMGAKGKRYHLQEDCRGLRSCQHKIVKISREEAQKQGLTLCGWEK